MAAHRLGLARETVRQLGSVARHHAASRSPMRSIGIALQHLRQHADAARVGGHEHAQLPGDDLMEEAVGFQPIAHACR